MTNHKRRQIARWMPTRPNIAFGIHVYPHRKYGYLSIHLPWGVLIVGYTGEHPYQVELRSGLQERREIVPVEPTDAVYEEE